MINFRSIADMSHAIVRGLPKVPRDIDWIVGVPRSGMLAANMLALYLNLPLTDVDGLLEGRVLGGGDRLRRFGQNSPSAPRKILVVDDSVHSGKAMRDVKHRLRQMEGVCELVYAAVYVNSRSKNVVDLYFEEIAGHRIFEWNVMHHSWLPECCVDIDGVLCEDPSELDNDDGPRYEQFLQNAKPLWLPTNSIGWLVTCRMEKYRSLTEEWLLKHNVPYAHLIMMDCETKSERRGKHGAFKASVYGSVGAKLFIESSHRQAVAIARLSGRPVLCVDQREMIYPSSAALCRNSVHHLARRLARSLDRGYRFAKRRLLLCDPPVEGHSRSLR